MRAGHAGIQIKVSVLTLGMHSGISSAGAGNSYVTSGNFRENIFQTGLNSSGLRLDLPAMEISTIITKTNKKAWHLASLLIEADETSDHKHHCSYYICITGIFSFYFIISILYLLSDIFDVTVGEFKAERDYLREVI